MSNDDRTIDSMALAVSDGVRQLRKYGFRLVRDWHADADPQRAQRDAALRLPHAPCSAWTRRMTPAQCARCAACADPDPKRRGERQAGKPRGLAPVAAASELHHDPARRLVGGVADCRQARSHEDITRGWRVGWLTSQGDPPGCAGVGEIQVRAFALIPCGDWACGQPCACLTPSLRPSAFAARCACTLNKGCCRMPAGTLPCGSQPRPASGTNP